MTEKPMTVEEAVSGLLKAIDFDLWKEDTEDDLSVIKEITRIINAQRAQAVAEERARVLRETDIKGLEKLHDKIRSEAVAEAMAWQPIKTAPRKETFSAIVYFQKPITRAWAVAEAFCNDGEWFLNPHTEEQVQVWPTHWKPLPAPPEGGMKG